LVVVVTGGVVVVVVVGATVVVEVAAALDWLIVDVPVFAASEGPLPLAFDPDEQAARIAAAATADRPKTIFFRRTTSPSAGTGRLGDPSAPDSLLSPIMTPVTLPRLHYEFPEKVTILSPLAPFRRHGRQAIPDRGTEKRSQRVFRPVFQGIGGG
jgi:hypothetical protein